MEQVMTIDMKSNIKHTARALPFGLTWFSVALIAIVILAAGVRLINADAFADGNTYYTAAVKNMLESPSNFFYAVADAGGVTVDKPPIALWIQGLFAAVLGISGFSVTLPSIIAGTLSVVLIYHLVQKGFGPVAGLIAAFTLAVTPVSVAVDRTNNLDSILIFTLLLATWAFIRATETGKWRHLLLGAVLIGVAFNVKMLQAYLIVPALYALYFFGASVPWRRKIKQLVVITPVLVAVSLSWALIVDLTPADQRPYVGGSTSNSVIDLAFGYNGTERLLGVDGPSGNNTNAAARPDDGSATGQFPDGGPQGAGPTNNVNRPGGSGEIGDKGITRLFEASLGNELAWLLPFGLLSIGVLGVRRRISLPLQREHQAAMLWGGWLVTGVVFFSISGFFHAYYLATLAPALAALVGIGAVTLWHIAHERRILGMLMAVGLVAVTLAVQVMVMGYYDLNSTPYHLALAAVALVLGASVVLVGWRHETVWLKVAAVAAVALVLVIPAMWSAQTALATDNTTVLPAAYAGESDSNTLDGAGQAGGGAMNQAVMSPVVEYIEDNGGDATYDLVVASSMVGSQIALDTDLRVLYWGGFNGQDAVYTTDSFAAMVEAGEIGFVLNTGGQSEISAWVSSTCTAVDSEALADLALSTDLAAMGMGMPPMGQPPQGMDNGNFPTPPQGAMGGMPMGAPGLSGASALYDCSQN